MRKLFTSESVTEGHPDKLCDYISDSILDAYIEKDNYARVACETIAGKGKIFLTGEISSSAEVDLEKVVRNASKEIDYHDENTDIMFGFATDETDNFMPMPIYLAHKLSKRLADVRKQKILDYIRPDGKVQVTVEYINDVPVRVDTIVLSTQHTENTKLEILKKDIVEKVIKQTIPPNLLDENTKYYINPTGRFVIGGPLGDSGLTRKKDYCRYLWRV